MREQTSERVSGLALLPAAAAAPVIRVLRQHQVLLAWAFAGGTTLAIGVYFWQWEGGLADTVFALAATLCAGAAIVCIGRRILVAAVLAAAMVGIVRTISYAKQQATEVLLHAYDLVTFMTSWSAWAGVWLEHRGLVLGLAVAVVATAAVSWIAARRDATRVSRLHAACALAILAGIAWTADWVRGPRRHTEFYFENIYVTFFYASWSETVAALWRGRLIETAAPRPPQHDRFELPVSCTPATKPPHVILIHQESVAPPALFPTLSYDRSLDGFFQSFDGRLNKLRVETFGGASWLTEFSVLTGLSTQSFGGMRQVL